MKTETAFLHTLTLCICVSNSSTGKLLATSSFGVSQKIMMVYVSRIRAWCGPQLCALGAAVGALLFGYTLGFTSPAQAAMVGVVFKIDACNNHKTTSEQASLFASLANVGAMAGALLAGVLTERYGRKKAVMMAAVPFTAGWTMIALGKTLPFWSFVIARLLTGVGVGIASVSVPTYITETSPDRLRGAMGTLNQFGIVWGIFVVYILGVLLPNQTNLSFSPRGAWSPTHTSGEHKMWCDPDQSSIQDNWPILAWVATGLSVGLFLVMLFMPESPKWLVQHGRAGDARAALVWLRGRKYDVDDELKNLESEEGNEKRGGLADLCVPALRMPIIICFTMMVVQQASGVNAVIFYVSDIFHDAGSTNDALSSLLVSTVQVVFTGLSALLIDRAGRKILLLLSTGGMAFFSLLLGMFFFINRNNADTPKYGAMALASVMGYIVFFSLGAGAIPWILMGELFPGKVRGIASSLATMLNWTLSFIITETFDKLKSSLKEYGTFWLFAAICFGGFLFVLLFVVETKGKTFQEIQAHFSKGASRSRINSHF